MRRTEARLDDTAAAGLSVQALPRRATDRRRRRRRAPKGDFVLPKETDRHYLFIAGGIGITVFRCMLRHIAEENLPHRITLVYSNRDRESAAFLDELAALGRNNPNLDIVLTMTEDPAWEGSHDASMPISCTTTWATIWAHSRTSSQARP